jgi:amino acid adenylation domain-containing protein
LAPDGTLFSWFQDNARQHPEATAIEVGDDRVRYRELADLVERLASRLVAARGRPPATVGLLTGRSLAGYAGYLAALRLAATVVPLSPEAPVARNAGICRSSGVDTILADPAGANQLSELAGLAGAARLRLGSDRGERPWYWSLAAPPWPEPSRSSPDDVAYVLFTSGSTGEPKGVPIRHRNLHPFLTGCLDRYQVGPGARFGQTFEFTFDGWVLATFTAWFSGATLVVPRAEELLAPARLVADRRLTHWCSVPSVASIAQRQGTLPPGSMPELRWSVFGGEQLTRQAAQAWAVAAPRGVIENHYGPTELTVGCVSYQLPTDPAQWPVTTTGAVPIGRVAAHLEAVVLTEDGRPGPEGELCVRGPQRFDGYLNPAQNRGSFVHFDGQRARPCERTDERTEVPADAWYRTGDRVRTTPDGLLLHLGRQDQQLKLRGYRVEPGEIESVLREHPRVAEAAVLAIPASAPADAPVLYAVYTGTKVDPDELVAFASRRLPPFMRPGHYRWVDEFPRTANGKLDRRRLAAELAE